MDIDADTDDPQTPWECRWTRLGQPVRPCNQRDARTVVWICTRGGHRRHVSEGECADCEHWQPPLQPHEIDEI